jgi:hypothetical protein
VGAVGGVEVAGRLVGEQYARARDQGAGDSGALHLPARQLARPVLEPVRQPDALEQLRRPPPQRAALTQPAPQGMRDHQRHQDVFKRRQLRQEVIELKDETERAVAKGVALKGGQVVDAFILQANLTLIGPVERAEQMEQRALTGAGSPDNADELAVLHLQIDAAQHVDALGVLAVGLVQVDGVEQGIHVILPFSRGSQNRAGVTPQPGYCSRGSAKRG